MRRRSPLIAVLIMLLAASGVSVMQDRRYVAADLAAGAPLSGAVVAGGFVFVSAVTGAGADGKLGDTIEAQTRQTIERLRAAVTAAGSS